MTGLAGAAQAPASGRTEAEVSDEVAAFVRPSGKPYRPRKAGLRAHSWEGEDDCGVVVFGTLDPERARPFAAQMCGYWYGMPLAVDPEPGWYRDGFAYGERRWVPDGKRGAPGVIFRAEDPPLVEVRP